MSSTNCDDKRVEDYLAGTLASRDRAETREHLIACRWCRDYYDYLRSQQDTISPPSISTAGSLRAKTEQLSRADETSLQWVTWMLQQPANEWVSVAASQPAIRTPYAVRYLLTLIRRHEHELAVRTLELATLVADLADMLADSDEASRLRCEAQRALSTANYGRGHYVESLNALRMADSHVVENAPDSDLQFAILANAEAVTLRKLGRPEEAREKLNAAYPVFLRYGERSLMADATYNYASLKFDGDSKEEAEAIFVECLQQMRDVGNTQMEAGCLFGIGQCRAGRGDLAGAVEYWAKASVLFDRCGMPAEKVRLTNAIARAKIQRGDYSDGMEELRAAWRSFLDLGKDGNADDVSLEIIENLVQHEKDSDEVVERASDLLRRARAGGRPVQAASALAYLHNSATKKTITVGLVRHVRRFIKDATAYPNLEFMPAKYT